MLSLLEEHEEATIQTLKHLIVYPLVMRNPTKNLMISALPQQVPAEAAEGRGGKVELFFSNMFATCRSLIYLFKIVMFQSYVSLREDIQHKMLDIYAGCFAK